jgi:hypothetical protein
MQAINQQSRPLIAALATAGVDLGKELADARKAATDAQRFVSGYETRYSQAQAALFSAAPAKFTEAAEKLVKAGAELLAAQQVAPTVAAAAENAVIAVLGQHSDNYQAQLVKLFDSVVAEHRLNDLGRALPKLTADGLKLDVLQMNAEQAGAVLAWRAASDKLRSIWAGHVSLAKFNGVELGPVGIDSLHTNMLTAVSLGAVTARQAQAAAQVFVSADVGSDQARAIAPLLPFVVAPMFGFDLRLRSPADAAGIQREFQVTLAQGVSIS